MIANTKGRNQEENALPYYVRLRKENYLRKWKYIEIKTKWVSDK